ncbi:hypothetical protein CUMW_121900 [Citrus unshiu]|nr:hypothetical protein CUMW_121900 [Citrus unshiu]
MASRHHTVRPVTTEAWNTTGLHVHRKRIAHMTFFWGHNTQVLFPGWPGSSTGMYVLALVFVFSLAVIVEWLSHYNIVKPGASRVAAGLFKTGLHGVRVGLAYMVVLAVMSFNGGIFIAAVVGHAVGYLLFGSRVEKGKMFYDHDHDAGMYMPPGSSMPDGSMNSTSMDMGMMMHMTFYWGKDVLVLFSGWPERSLGMYILALIFVFLLGFAVEVLSISPRLVGSNSMAALLIQACVYVVRMALAYMVMLSVMSFNLGVFIVAVAGHGAGFLLVKARALAAANRADSAVPSAGISSKV